MPDPAIDTDMTLDPPGTIAIVGAGPLGIEAALYGRFLGYDVTLIEAESVGHSIRQRGDDPLPMLPDRCLSPLALSALSAQVDEPLGSLPMTCGEWVEQGLARLTGTDLLDGRLRMPCRVTQITTVEVRDDDDDDETDAQGDDDDPIPPDFRLTLVQESSPGESGDDTPAGESTIDAEAVVIATGTSDNVRLDFPQDAAYFFRIGNEDSGDAEQNLRKGLAQIVAIYASLAGRADLDLYRPTRG